tara:strand:- start:122 stop:376 length:255 start_codon:yes stop_codon:yes gene_type:complete
VIDLSVIDRIIGDLQELRTQMESLYQVAWDLENLEHRALYLEHTQGECKYSRAGFLNVLNVVDKDYGGMCSYPVIDELLEEFCT